MDFRDLDALHAAHDLVVEIHDVSQSFPSDDQFTLGAAICAAALELPALLADGCGRTDGNALAETIDKASGLTSRLEYLILLAGELGLVDEETLGELGEVLAVLKSELAKGA
jgi:four helix bundle protein